MVVVERNVEHEEVVVVVVDINCVLLAGVESEMRVCLLLFGRYELAIAGSILLNAR